MRFGGGLTCADSSVTVDNPTRDLDELDRADDDAYGVDDQSVVGWSTVRSGPMTRPCKGCGRGGRQPGTSGRRDGETEAPSCACRPIFAFFHSRTVNRRGGRERGNRAAVILIFHGTYSRSPSSIDEAIVKTVQRARKHRDEFLPHDEDFCFRRGKATTRIALLGVGCPRRVCVWTEAGDSGAY